MKCIPFILFFFSLFACSKNPKNIEKFATISQEQIEHILEQQTFECAPIAGGKRCPEGVARIFVLDPAQPDRSSLCSGFLMDSNILVTNHHCISNQNDCKNTFVSVFNGETHESARCKSIIEARDDGKPDRSKSYDYAVIELDHYVSTSGFFKFSERALKGGDKVTLWVVDHLSKFEARITEFRCTYQKRFPSLELSHCPAISGNSGSPALDRSGHVIGVLWGATTGEKVTEQTPLPKRRAMNEYSYVTEMSWFKKAVRGKSPH